MTANSCPDRILKDFPEKKIQVSPAVLVPLLPGCVPVPMTNSEQWWLTHTKMIKNAELIISVYIYIAFFLVIQSS